MRIRQSIKKSGKLFSKKGIMPEYITFFVTNRCNARCGHCFYWKELETEKNELSLAEIENFSTSMDDFLFLILTGGEPFLRKDLAEIAEVFYKNNNVRKMNIITNGLLTERIISVMEDMTERCPDFYISLFVSIDEIGERHDAIRGVKGIYEKAAKTIEKLKKLKKSKPKLTVGAAMTYSYLNEGRILETYRQIKDELKPDTINCSFVRGDTKSGDARACGIENYVRLQEIFRKDLIEKNVKGVSDPLLANLVAAAKFESTSQLIKTVKEDRYLFPCFAGSINAVIYPEGDVFPCELLDEKMGNLRESGLDFRKVWFSKRADEVREKIKKTRCFCTHECNLLPNVIFNPRFMPSILTNYVRLLAKR
ncbi:MAG: radical SAM protein [Nitrospirae bacterium]|nr:radical SAM protein [Nitrospirota bacterium]